MVNKLIERTVCDYYGVALGDAMNPNIHTRRATEARYFIWFFLRYYCRYPAVMLSEIYGFSRRQVHQGISFIKDASRTQKQFIVKSMELYRRLGYSNMQFSENKRMYVERNSVRIAPDNGEK